jgi:hypothetical protein
MSEKEINAFLDWFAGWSENIDGVPTQKQWERLTGKIAAIPRMYGQAACAEPVIYQNIATGTPLPNGRTMMDEREWRRALKLALEDMGCDEAAQMSSQEAYDGRVDPDVIARMIYSVE